MRFRAGAIATIVIAGCSGGSLLDPPDSSSAAAPILAVESTGGQSPKIVGLYVEQLIKRVRVKCSPAAGTTAQLALTVDRRGFVAEVGMRASTETLVPCARSELKAQRFPRAKSSTLIGVRLEF